MKKNDLFVGLLLSCGLICSPVMAKQAEFGDLDITNSAFLAERGGFESVLPPASYSEKIASIGKSETIDSPKSSNEKDSLDGELDAIEKNTSASSKKINRVFSTVDAVVKEVTLSQTSSNYNPVGLKLKSGVTAESAVSEAQDTVVLPQLLKSGITLFSPKGIEFDEGPLKTVKMGLVYGGTMSLYKEDYMNLSSKFSNDYYEMYINSKLRDNKTQIRFQINYLRNLKNTTNGFTEKISEISVIHDFNEHQQVTLGQGKRIPIGVDGQSLPQYLDFALRSQIGRTFSDSRSYGVRNIGNYKYMDYDIGLYDSTRYLQQMFNGTEFAGWVNFRPLANLDSKKYGALTLGTGYDFGSADEDFSVIGAYLGYKYKKVTTKFEYAHANGYNGLANSSSKAQGFYSSILYDIHPKLQLAARYDYLDPNVNRVNNGVEEYSIGLNYFVTKKMKVILNYVRQEKEIGPDSNMFILLTRFFI